MKQEYWQQLREKWSDEAAVAATLIEKRKLAAVLQCGGRGRRLRRFEPKPLVLLPDGDRPLDKLIQDVPPEVAVFLHGMSEEQEKYLAYLAARNNFGRRVRYLVQQEDTMYYDRLCSVPIKTSDGCRVTGSDGPATFCRQFATPPDFFFVTDGSKLGVNFLDVVLALQQLIEHPTAEMIAFSVELNEAEIEQEKKNHEDPKRHTHYARIDVASQKIYEFPDVTNEYMIHDRKCQALSGMYVVKAKPLIQAVDGVVGVPTKLESVNSLHEGWVQQIKMSMVMKGFPCQTTSLFKGLHFDTYQLDRKSDSGDRRLYVNGLKTKADVEGYGENVVAKSLDKERKQRESKPSDSEEQISKIGILFQCAGLGDRLGKLMPEPLVVLPDDERPITLLLKETPHKIPVYLHLQHRHRRMFMELLNEYQYYDHEVSYLIQEGTPLHDLESGEILCDKHGVKVMATNGPATFGTHLVLDNMLERVPEFLVLADGDKLGLDFELMQRAVGLLEKQEDRDVVAIVRKLSAHEKESENDRVAGQAKRRRYALVTGLEQKGEVLTSCDNSRICHPADIEQAESTIWDSPEAYAFCGFYVVRTKSFVARCSNVRSAPFSHCWSFNSLHYGKSRVLKEVMCLQGYESKEQLPAIPFLALEIESKEHWPGIKEDRDIEGYPEWKKTRKKAISNSIDSVGAKCIGVTESQVLAEVWLVRHGQSEVNCTDSSRFAGANLWSELTPEGRQQAKRLGSQWCDEKIDHWICSPAVRAQQTCRLCQDEILKSIAARSGVNAPPVWPIYEMAPELSELFQGEAEGRLKTDFVYAELQDSGQYIEMQEGGGDADWWRAKPLSIASRKFARGAESQEDVFERSVCFLKQRIMKVVEPESIKTPKVVVFTHETVMKCLCYKLFAIPFYRTKIGNCTVIKLGYTEDGWRLLGVDGELESNCPA